MDLKVYERQAEMEKPETRVQTLKARCDELARLGTGFGSCDQPLDEHGDCPRASDHVELS